MKRLIGLVLMAALFTGCEGATDIAVGVSRQLTSEQSQYQVLLTAAQSRLRGEPVAQKLKNWADTVVGINTRMDQLNRRLREHPSERASLDQAAVAQVRARFDQFFARQGEAELLIPRWRLQQATEDKAHAEAAVSDLRSKYTQFFGQPAPGDEHSRVRLTVDERLFDTFDLCVAQVTAFGVGANDDTCGRIAREVCGHQMKLVSCVAVQIVNGAREGGCTIEDCQYDPHLDQERCTTSRARWIQGLSQCHSNTPVENPWQ